MSSSNPTMEGFKEYLDSPGVSTMPGIANMPDVIEYLNASHGPKYAILSVPWEDSFRHTKYIQTETGHEAQREALDFFLRYLKKIDPTPQPVLQVNRKKHTQRKSKSRAKIELKPIPSKQDSEIVTPEGFEKFLYSPNKATGKQIVQRITNLNKTNTCHAFLSVSWEDSFHNLNYIQASTAVGEQYKEAINKFLRYLAEIKPAYICRNSYNAIPGETADKVILSRFELFLKNSELPADIIARSVQSLLHLHILVQKNSGQDLITQDIINARSILRQLKRDLSEKYSSLRLNNLVCRQSLAYYDAFLDSNFQD